MTVGILLKRNGMVYEITGADQARIRDLAAANGGDLPRAMADHWREKFGETIDPAPAEATTATKPADVLTVDELIAHLQALRAEHGGSVIVGYFDGADGGATIGVGVPRLVRLDPELVRLDQAASRPYAAKPRLSPLVMEYISLTGDEIICS